jgi:hypothetical protein
MRERQAKALKRDVAKISQIGRRTQPADVNTCTRRQMALAALLN